MNALLENAIVSIQLGLEDYASKDGHRVISAVRNLYAGVLLLCKEALRRLSPPGSNDILIRTRKKVVKNPDGTVRFVGAGKHTIDRAEIEQTFKELQLNVDLSTLKRLAAIRNDIEHMHSGVGPALIQEAIADAMPIIHAIIVKELQEEPGLLLGADAWDTLLEEATVFKQVQDVCQTSFDEVDWGSEVLAEAVNEFQCPHCTSTLIRNENAVGKYRDEVQLVCSQCGETAEPEAVFEDALQRALELNAYEAMKDGGGPPLANCPECLRDAFIVDEGQCVNCGLSLEGRKCGLCGEDLSVDDYRVSDGYYCSYHQYVVSKDD